MTVLVIALLAAASVQALAAEGQSPILEKKEMKRVHKRARTHVKKTTHRKIVHERVGLKRMPNKRGRVQEGCAQARPELSGFRARPGRGIVPCPFSFAERVLPWIAALIVSVVLAAAPSARAQATLPEVELNAGQYLIHAELAASPATRMRGLMGRHSILPDHGMLFVFGRPGVYCMWMKDTLIPLSVAFLDGHGVIINVAHMRPLTENPHCALRPARYALEMNLGWFLRRGVGPGARLGGLRRAR